MKDKTEKGYHKLLVWQKARRLVILIYKYTEDFPKQEEFGLKSQLRRAAVSVVLNIVEGNRRSSRKEFLHFLNMAVSSLTEIEAGWELCLDLKFISIEKYEETDDKITELSYLISRLIKNLRK